MQVCSYGENYALHTCMKQTLACQSSTTGIKPSKRARPEIAFSLIPCAPKSFDPLRTE